MNEMHQRLRMACGAAIIKGDSTIAIVPQQNWEKLVQIIRTEMPELKEDVTSILLVKNPDDPILYDKRN